MSESSFRLPIGKICRNQIGLLSGLMPFMALGLARVVLMRPEIGAQRQRAHHGIHPCNGSITIVRYAT